MIKEKSQNPSVARPDLVMRIWVCPEDLFEQDDVFFAFEGPPDRKAPEGPVISVDTIAELLHIVYPSENHLEVVLLESCTRHDKVAFLRG